MAQWRFWLADSPTMTNLFELRDSSDRDISLSLNKSGSLSFKYPLYSQNAPRIEVIKTCIKAYRNNQLKWSGPVWGIQEQTPGNSFSVNAVGWGEILNHRFINPGQATTYTTTDTGLIAHSLLVLANAKGPILSSNYGAAPSSTFITAGQRDASQTLTKTYENWQNIGAEIDHLSNIINGFDYIIDPTTRALNIHYPQLGSAKPGIILSSNPPSKNLQSASRQIDASKMCNNVVVLGSNGLYGGASDVNSQNQFGLFEDAPSSISSTDQTFLDAYANSEVAVRGTPQITYSIVPLLQNQLGQQPFQDYNIGDTISMRISAGRFTVLEQAIRVFGINISIDNNGNEIVSSLDIVYS